MKKKKKINLKKFIPRVIILVLLIVLIMFIKNIMFKEETNNVYDLSLIVDKEDITNSLQSSIYIDKDGILYMSMEDVKNVFDENIIYEESSGKIITSAYTKVGAFDLQNNLVEINSATVSMPSSIIDYGTTYYLPISAMSNIYNIEVYTSDKKAIVLSLYKELSTAKTNKNISLKKEPGIFKKTLEKIDAEKDVIFIEKAKKGWVKVLTYEGNIGYVKEKDIGEIQKKRTDMKEEDFTNKVADLSNSIEINNKTLTDEKVTDFANRKQIVEDVIKQVIKEEKFTININLSDVNASSENIERLIIELTPRLKEIGGCVVVTNNSLLSNEFLNKYNLI